MRTTRVLPYGGLPDRDPQTETSLDRDHPDRDPPDRDPLRQRPPLDRDPLTEIPSRQRTPPGQRFLRQRPPCGHTNTCENITFANFVCGGVKIHNCVLINALNSTHNSQQLSFFVIRHMTQIYFQNNTKKTKQIAVVVTEHAKVYCYT